MATGGSFISEAFLDGVTYYFEATFTLWRWSANFWDERGHRCGSIACSPMAPHLDGDELEDAVCDWVHRAVQHEVGFVRPRTNRTERIGAHFGPVPHAANAARYGERDPTREATKDANFRPKTVQAQHVELRFQSAMAINHFCRAAEDFQRLWLALEPRRRAQLLGATGQIPLAASFQAVALPPG